MTFIVVPHGGRDLNTRSFEIPYRRLRLAGLLLLVAVVVWLVMAISWVYVAGQAARVPLLQREVARLQQENAQITRLADALRRLEAQYEQVRQMLGANQPHEPGSLWLPPVGEGSGRQSGPPPGADSTEAFVPRAWPLSRRGFVTREHLSRLPGQHPGIDIAVAEGTYVRAAGAGVVQEAAEDRVYGKYVRIRHGRGYESLYGHASELFVTPNDSVERNQVIALSGNTGTSTAPHLHFEIWKDGQPIDPQTLVEQPK